MHLLSRAYRFYVGSFDGLSREVWILAFVTFVNRAGTMVIPFLSLYLTMDMGLTLPQVGWVMSCFGAGSVIGSWIGGRLTDRLGFYEVMVGALLASGSAFIFLQFIDGYIPFCIGIFCLTLVSDAFRPAMFVAISSYSRPENRTRAVTLIRLAINLGFSLGPAIGGLIIAYWSYGGLFWIDGLTCYAAVGLMLFSLPRKQKVEVRTEAKISEQRSPYTDRPYLVFLLATVLISIPFLQYFSTMPLFYSEVFHMSEFWIGLLLGLNGLLIFLIEMPLIKYCEDRKFDLFHIVQFSVVLLSLSFVVLNVFPSAAVLWVGMVFMTFGEMLNFPFMNRFAYERSDQGAPGAYMAMFTMSWSVAHIVGHTLGLNSVAVFGFESTWYFCAGILLVALLLVVVLKRMVAKEVLI